VGESIGRNDVTSPPARYPDLYWCPALTKRSIVCVQTNSKNYPNVVGRIDAAEFIVLINNGL
jgi:hypothetical protein